MKNGVYLLTFESNSNDFGTGILVVNNSVANGGDGIYSYSGKIDDKKVILDLFKHNLEAHSFFGNFGKIKLNLAYHPEPQGYILRGNVENIQTVPLTVTAKFIGQLA